MANPAPPFVIRVGLHSLNQSYSEVACSWEGINISIAATVDKGDSSHLSLVVSTAATIASKDSKYAQSRQVRDSSCVYAVGFTC